MVHEMQLDPIHFEKVLHGEKTLEVRLFDEKRSLLNLMDYIIFSKRDGTGWLTRLAVRVTALHRYPSFFDMFTELPPEDAGFPSGTTPEDAAAYMERYYTPDEARAYTVLGIRLALCDLKEAAAEKEAEALAQYARLFPDGMK